MVLGEPMIYGVWVLRLGPAVFSGSGLGELGTREVHGSGKVKGPGLREFSPQTVGTRSPCGTLS